MCLQQKLRKNKKKKCIYNANAYHYEYGRGRPTSRRLTGWCGVDQTKRRKGVIGGGQANGTLCYGTGYVLCTVQLLQVKSNKCSYFFK